MGKELLNRSLGEKLTFISRVRPDGSGVEKKIFRSHTYMKHLNEGYFYLMPLSVTLGTFMAVGIGAVHGSSVVKYKDV